VFAFEGGKKGDRSSCDCHFFLLFDYAAMASGTLSDHVVPRFIVANLATLCHKRKLHRPADQGLPWRCPCWMFRLGNSQAFSTL
jgi:hypothetical protein